MWESAVHAQAVHCSPTDTTRCALTRSSSIIRCPLSRPEDRVKFEDIFDASDWRHQHDFFFF